MTGTHGTESIILEPLFNRSLNCWQGFLTPWFAVMRRPVRMHFLSKIHISHISLTYPKELKIFLWAADMSFINDGATDHHQGLSNECYWRHEGEPRLRALGLPLPGPLVLSAGLMSRGLAPDLRRQLPRAQSFCLRQTPAVTTVTSPCRQQDVASIRAIAAWGE